MATYKLSQHAIRILRRLQRVGNSARVDLANAFDLSPTTVTAITGSLLEQGLIEEEENGGEARGRGRPRVLLSLKPTALSFAGVNVFKHGVSLSIVDFTGKPIAEAEQRHQTARFTGIDLVRFLKSSLEKLVSDSNIEFDQIAGIGVSMPGFVSGSTGLVHWSPVLLGNDVSLLDLLREGFSCPVSLENNANIATLAERWYGRGVDVENFVVVTVEHGIGLGAFVHGNLLRGARGFAGEFGHTKIVVDGALCACGQRGCVEAYVSNYAIAKEAQIIDQNYLAAEEGLAGPMQRLADRARAGDVAVAQLFSRAGNVFGVGISNLVNLLNPSRIIISGANVQHYDLIKDAALQAIDKSVIAPEIRQTELEISDWDGRLWTQGAAALALDNWFEQKKTLTG